jgi:hypothetical protein
MSEGSEHDVWAIMAIDDELRVSKLARDYPRPEEIKVAMAPVTSEEGKSEPLPSP